jgi:hypothetical protein
MAIEVNLAPNSAGRFWVSDDRVSFSTRDVPVDEAVSDSEESFIESRPDRVARARRLIANGDYPSRETTRKIASLFAFHWSLRLGES